MNEIFGPVLFSYSRAQAITDGELVDVSSSAREVGIKFPVAISRAAFIKFVEWTTEDSKRRGVEQDQKGRLMDVLTMFAQRARRFEGDTMRYQFLCVPRDGKGTQPKISSMKAVIGPGDTPAPVITLMLMGED
jgi:hypothetical protein